MELYHASPTAGLKVLRPRVTEYFDKPRQVCLTALRPMALFYGIRHFEYTYGFTRDGALYEEYFPNALEELYRGKSASLYRCPWRERMEATQIPYEYVSAGEVPVEEETPIPDVCEALLEQERSGALRIIRWEALTEKRRRWISRAEADTILAKDLVGQDTPFARFMREKYPESWETALREREERGT